MLCEGIFVFLDMAVQGFYERSIVFLSFFVVWLFDVCLLGIGAVL